MKYTVKGIKTFIGHDGDPNGGMECSLYLDGKRLGKVLDDSWGGGLIFHIPNEEKEKLDEYCKTLPKYVSKFGSFDMKADLFVEKLVNETTYIRNVKKKCKNNTVWRTTDQKDGEMFVLNRKFSIEVKKNIEKQYPNLEVIYNELYKTI